MYFFRRYNSINTKSNNLSIMQNSLNFQIVEEADYKHNSYGKKAETYRFEGDHFLQLHVVLVYGHAVVFSLFYLLEYFVYVLYCSVDLF